MKNAIFPLLCLLALATWIVALKRHPIPHKPLPYADAVELVQETGDLIPPEIALGLAERGEYHLVGEVEDLPLEVEWIARYDDWTLEQIEAELSRLHADDGPWLAVYKPVLSEKYASGQVVYERPEPESGQLVAPVSDGAYIVVRETDLPEGFVELERISWLEDRARHLRH